jgi:predicted acyltransferase
MELNLESTPFPSPVLHFDQNVDGRLVSLDVFRGLIVAGMILVTDPGTYSAVYWPLLHAQWNGATPTDMIFPSFLVIVGVAMTLSFASRLERAGGRGKLLLHVLRRSVLLFFLGLLVNGFPDYNPHTIRIPGVLQRIALCYFAGSLLYFGAGWVADRKTESRSLRRSTVIGAAFVGLLALYWALLKLYPVPGFGAGRLDSLGNVGAYVDRYLLGVRHMWLYGTTPGYGVTFDPEGLLSTIPALATLLTGVLAGEWMRTSYSRPRKVAGLAGAAACLMIAGYALSPLLPLNKKIGTSTFAIFSSGVALLAFSFFYFVLDIRRWRRWVTPALVLGTNAILAFVLSNVITTLTDRLHVTAIDGGSISLHKWVYQYGFATWLQPVHASLAYAIGIVILNVAIVYPLYRKRIFLRV